MALQHFREQLKEYFTFTKKERNGIVVLIFLLISMQAFIIYTHFLNPPAAHIDVKAFEKELQAFEMSLLENKFSRAMAPAVSADSVEAAEIKYFAFDPNTTNKGEWEQLGINKRTVSAIENFLAKGGRFFKKEDLKKIYTLKAADYARIEPYILIPESKKYQKENSFSKVENKPISISIELNTATKEELMLLPMIGEKRAEHILKYRTLLGGFVAKEQLKEVFSIPDSVYQMALPCININEDVVRKLNINTDSIGGLRHIYIKRPVAQLIVNYRLQHGNYQSIEEIRKLPLVSDSLFNRIAAYLQVE